MSTNEAPDWGALYLRHRDAMHRVAASVLRDAGLEAQSADAVQEAMVSLMTSPPTQVDNWQAVMVTAAKRKAIDRLRSADVRHAGPELSEEHHPLDADFSDDVAAALDRQRLAAQVFDSLAVLDVRHRKALWEYVALERPRTEVAAELGVTPARVSQMCKRGLELLRESMSQKEGSV